MLNFGSILRELRLERGLTQAEVGDGIGVSSQAISKWENENGLPDVIQLIPLADYFGVTLDYLLGHDPDKNEQEITAHIERLEGILTDEGKWHEQLEENCAMLRKYPKDCRLMLQMCRILYYLPKQTGIDCTPESDKLADELVEWGERILHQSTDARIRNEAVRWLVYTLEIQGKSERGRKYAEMMPPYELCRENLMWYLFDDDMEQLKFHQEFGVRIFRDSVRSLTDHAGWLKDNIYTLEERLRLCVTARSLMEAYFPDGDYPSWVYETQFNSYLEESEIYVEMGCTEEALNSLRKAVDTVESMKAAAGKEIMHTSPFVNTICCDLVFDAGGFAYQLKYYLKYTGRDDSGIITYYKNEKARIFAENPLFKAEIERFKLLCNYVE